jgi:hypothetical protein
MWLRPAESRAVGRLPDLEVYLLLSLLAIAHYGIENLLLRAWFQSHYGLGFGPGSASAITAAAIGLPGLIAAVITIVPRVIRAWGAKAKDTGEGDGAASTGRADIIRAEKEGEAAIIRAQAELTRAQAEMKRAELGLEPLPPTYILSPPEVPPALGGPTSNGGPPDSGSPA